jgi:hypothetical protein
VVVAAASSGGGGIGSSRVKEHHNLSGRRRLVGLLGRFVVVGGHRDGCIGVDCARRCVLIRWCGGLDIYIYIYMCVCVQKMMRENNN